MDDLARVRIIAVGDELLEGRTADTNSRRIQQALGSHAVQVDLIQVVPDSLDAIAAALDRTDPGDLVFLTGGLGSTPDDLTRDAVASWAKVDLAEDPAVRDALEERWRSRGIRTRPGVSRQAQVPAGMAALENPVGSAPGLVGRLLDRWVALLPGVPQELAGLLPLVLAALDRAGALPRLRRTLLWRTAQVAELSLARQCEPLQLRHPRLHWSWWLTDWGVDVRVAADPGDEDALESVGAELDRALGPVVFSRRAVSLPQAVQDLMLARGATLAVAESCTAGLIGGALTTHGGSSGFFRGGFLVYADQVKTALLGVDPEVLRREGAVSEGVVRAMASGARDRLGTDYAIAVSGISGPGGGSEDKPVGTTWIALATPGPVWTRRYRFPAGRDRNRLLTVASAMDSLRRLLEGGDEVSPWSAADTWGSAS